MYYMDQNKSLSLEMFSSSSRGGISETNTGMMAGENDMLAYWKHIGYVIFSVGMVFGAHIGYVFQFHEVYTTNNVDGYSLLVSLILLTSNSIRILYYVGHKFALALLFQSIFALIVHIMLVLEVLYVIHFIIQNSNDYMGTTNPDSEYRERDDQLEISLMIQSSMDKLDKIACYLEESVLGMPPAAFFRSVCTWGLFITVAVLLYYATIGSLWSEAPELIGYLALGTEALLVVPQILRNYRRSSTEGLTMVLVFTWVAGDIIKVAYFFLDNQPVPFIMCGIFQIALDCVVVAQIIYYRSSRCQASVVAVGSAEALDATNLRDAKPGRRGC